MADITGRPATEVEKRLAAAAALLSPEKTLERLDGFAKYLLGLASLVASLITGFGVLGATALPASPLLFIPAAMFSASLGLAISGLIPRLRTVAPGDLSRIASYYDEAIRTRHRYIWLAGVLFAGGILAAPICIYLTKRAGAGAVVASSAQLALGQSDSLTLTGKVEGRNLAAGECVRARGIAGAQAVFDSIGARGANNEAAIVINVPGLSRAASSTVRIETSIVPCPAAVDVTLR